MALKLSCVGNNPYDTYFWLNLHGPLDKKKMCFLLLPQPLTAQIAQAISQHREMPESIVS